MVFENMNLFDEEMLRAQKTGALAVQATEAGITRDMGTVPKFLTDTALSAGQSFANMPLGTAGLINMGLGAATQTAQNKMAQGATREQALTYATVAGAIEVATEKIPFEQMTKIFSKSVTKATTKEIVKDVLKNMGTEATEEAISNVADNIADRIIFQDKSEYEQYAAELMKSGVSEEEAYRKAFLKLFVEDTATSALGGAVSSLMLGSVPLAINGTRYVNDTIQTGKEYRDAGAARGVVSEGLKSDAATDANKYATKLHKKDESGKSLSHWNIGRQVQKNAAAIAAENSLLKSLQRNTGVETNVVDDIPNANGRFTPNKGESVKTSIKEDENGNKYVSVDEHQNLFSEKSTKDYTRIARNFMNEHYKGEVLPLSEYNLVKSEKRGIEKYVHSGKDIDNNIYNAKMKASSELHNLLEAAEYVGSSQDAKNHSFAKYGFEYYKTKFVVDGQTFEGIIDIGVSDKGATFYGMTNVKRTAYSGQPSELWSDVTAELNVGGSVNNSIPNSGENVKKNFRGKVEISSNADTSVPATAGHEFTHAFKANAPEAYSEFENYILQAAEETNAAAVNKRISELKRKFGYSDDVAREEVAAEVAESFLRDRDSIDDLIKDNPTLADKISQAITSAKARLKTAVSSPFRNRTGVELTYSQLNRAEKLWSKALKAAETSESASGEVKHSVKENSESDAKELVNKWRDHNYDATRTDYYEPLIDLIYDRAAKTSAEYEGYFVTDMQEELGYETEMVLDPIIRAAFRNPEQIPDMSDQKTYYRIGDLRTNGYNGYLPSRNFATGYDELGVSVISSEWLNNLKSTFFGLSDEQIAERGVYEVVGFEVAKGGDGEPLIFVTEEPRFRDDIDTVEELVKEVEWEENNSSDVRFSMKEDNAGNAYVEIDEDILDGVAPNERRKVIKNYIKNNFSTIKVNDRNIIVNAKSRGEFTNSAYSRMLERTNDTAFADKLRMSRNLDEILQNQTNIAAEDLTHNRNDIINGFERGNVRVKVGENFYNAEVLIGNRTDGDGVFYDIVGLKNTDAVPRVSSQEVNNSGRNQQSVFSEVQPAPNPGRANANTEDGGNRTVSSDNSIRQNDGGVKYSMKENDTYGSTYRDYAVTTPSKLATEIMEKYELAGLRHGEIKESLTEIWELITHPTDTYDEHSENLSAAIDKIVELGREIAEAQVDEYTSEEYTRLKNHLKGTSLKLATQDKSDVRSASGADTFNEFRKRNFGRIKLTNTGIPLDSYYQELSQLFPEYFNAERETHPAEQLARIEEVLDELRKPRQVSDEQLTEEGTAIALELFDRIITQPGRAEDNDLSSKRNADIFAHAVDNVFSGNMPTGNVITIGDTPKLLQKYGAGDLPITINQSTMYKIAYPTGYFGAEKQGHNLGIPALKQLPKQIANPMAILTSNSQDNSLILLTAWEDTEGNSVIVPLHLDKNGAIGFSNEVASAYGKENIDALLTDKNGNSTVKYTKNNKDIHKLLSAGLQLPGAVTDDTLVKKSISRNAENVNTKNKDSQRSAQTAQKTNRTNTVRNETNATDEAYWKHLMESEGEVRPTPEAERAARRIIKSIADKYNSEIDPNEMTAHVKELNDVLKDGAKVKDENYMTKAWEKAVDIGIDIAETVRTGDSGLDENEILSTADEIAARLINDVMRDSKKLSKKYNAQMGRFIDEAREAGVSNGIINKFFQAHNSDRRSEYIKWRKETMDRQKLFNLAREVGRMKLSPENKAKIPDILQRIDTMGVKILPKGYTRKDGVKITGLPELKELSDSYKKIQQENPDFIPDPKIEQKIGRLSQIQIGDMEIGDVRDLISTIQQIKHEIQTNNKMLNDKKNREISETASAVRREVRASKGINYLRRKDRFLDKYNSMQLSPVREFRRLAGYAKSGVLDGLANDLNDGQRESIRFTKQIEDKFASFAKDKKNMEKLLGKNAEMIDISMSDPDTLIGAEGQRLLITPAMRISLYLHSKNNSNLRHIANGGIVIPNAELYKKGDFDNAYNMGETVRLQPSQVKKITDGMTDFEKRFANMAHEVFNGDMRDAINKTSLALDGYEKAVCGACHIREQPQMRGLRQQIHRRLKLHQILR